MAVGLYVPRLGLSRASRSLFQGREEEEEELRLLVIQFSLCNISALPWAAETNEASLKADNLMV